MPPSMEHWTPEQRAERKTQIYELTLMEIAMAYRHAAAGNDPKCPCAGCVAARTVLFFNPELGNSASAR